MGEKKGRADITGGFHVIEACHFPCPLFGPENPGYQGKALWQCLYDPVVEKRAPAIAYKDYAHGVKPCLVDGLH